MFRLPREFDPMVAADFIREAEGLELQAYSCSAGRRTIGYGHTQGVKPGMKITLEEAEAFLKKDLEECHRAIVKWVDQCTEGQYIALASFIFNLGERNFSSSTLLRRHLSGDYKAASAEFGRWINVRDPKTGKLVPSNGLKNRRERERKLYVRDL